MLTVQVTITVGSLQRFKEFLEQAEEDAADALDNPGEENIVPELAVEVDGERYILDAFMKDE